jgi:hypothetical protein
MPTQKQKPSSSAKPQPSKKPAKSTELKDDDLRTISGGMTSAGLGTTSTCVTQIG